MITQFELHDLSLSQIKGPERETRKGYQEDKEKEKKTAVKRIERE